MDVASRETIPPENFTLSFPVVSRSTRSPDRRGNRAGSRETRAEFSGRRISAKMNYLLAYDSFDTLR